MTLLSLDEARARALSTVAPAPPVRLPLLEALGTFLAEEVRATRDLPGSDNSAMDGYALRSGRTKGATRDAPTRLQVTRTVYAGATAGGPLAEGEAARIFTGAPMPEGADCVVRQEATSADGGAVLLFVEASPGEHIRRRGEELHLGERVFSVGQRVEPAVAGMLASLGLDRAVVRPRPKVAVLTVGDELLPPGATALPHQIYESNGVLLSALAREAGAEVLGGERLSDEDDVLRAGLERWLARADLVVTAGGASVGDRDRVKAVLRALGGTFEVDGVAIKPGKPVGVGTVAGKPVAVLPGNPGAATVAFDQLVRPMLLRLQGVAEERARHPVRLDTSWHKQAGLTWFLSARLEPTPEGPPLARIRPQGAGQILQNVGMEGWVVLPRGKADFAAGEVVDFERLHGATYRPVEG
ncbi:MAG TPA: gephyrin-like molybdotransferase Glp [Myxococcaceae bacterium]|nr:gephyrin-like molybdotransferase Glp [Myxococcaceae bacterium]